MKISLFPDKKNNGRSQNGENIDSIYSNIIPLNSNYSNSFYSNTILNDCRLKDVYYALPFSASYNFMFYNKYYVNEVVKEMINENISWEDIERIIGSIITNKNFSNIEGIRLSLNNKEKITSLFLEGLFFNSTIYDRCFSNNKINKSFFNANDCVSSTEFFYGEQSESWIGKLKNYIEQKYINPNCFELEDGFTDFIFNYTSVFYIGDSNDYSEFQYIINSSYPQNSKSNNNIQMYGNYYDVTLLPGKFSTYNSYVLIGNKQLDKDKRKIVSNVLEILSSENAQIQRARDFKLTPTFDFTKYENLGICQEKSIPCDMLKEIKPISLTKSILNRESVSNNEIFETISDYLKTEKSVNFKNSIKNCLTLLYTKYNDVAGIINITYFCIGNLYALILIMLILINKEKFIQIEKTSPMIYILFIIGITCTFHFPIFNVGIPSKLSCTLNHYFLYILLSISLSCYFIKIWKILYILNGYKSKVFGIKLSDYSLSSIITAIITIELLLNILWDVVSPRRVGVLTIQSSERIPNCTSEHDLFFNSFIILVNILMFIFLFIFTFKTKKATDYYSDYVAFLIATVLSILGIALTSVTLLFSFSFFQAEIVNSTTSFLLGIIILSAIVLPKIIETLTGKSLKKRFTTEINVKDVNFKNNNINIISFKDFENNQNDDHSYDNKFINIYLYEKNKSSSSTYNSYSDNTTSYSNHSSSDTLRNSNRSINDRYFNTNDIYSINTISRNNNNNGYNIYNNSRNSPPNNDDYNVGISRYLH